MLKENFKISFHKIITVSCIFWCMIFFMPAAFAQKADTANKVNVNIIHSTVGGGITIRDTQMYRLVGDVQLEQNGTLMFCDSAYINMVANNVEAYGNVKIVQPGGTQVESDYLRYTGNKKLAYLKGNVSLTDGKNHLWCEELNYDLTTKVGVYTQGGTLQSESTTVSSNSGNYNVKTHDARFTGDVYITDPQYEVTSQDLGYNTETKLVTFYSCSIVTNPKSILRTCSGSWDGKNQIAHFTGRSSLKNEAQYIEADYLDYNKVTGMGLAEGKVISIDTIQKTTLYCGKAIYNEKMQTLKAMIKPVLKKLNGKDSLFIRADTFFSAPVPRAGDTIKLTKTKKIKGPKGKVIITETDSIAKADTSAPRYFIGYHGVIIFSDSLQGRCDSISYSQKDSVMRMMIAPVAWTRQSQMTGDTILMYTDSGKLSKVYVPNNALMVSQTGPDKAKMFDQVQGKTLTGYLKNNGMDRMVVWPNAESIYYPKDDSGAYLGVEQATSERMTVIFDDQQISKILLEQDPKLKMTPIPEANISEMKLSRFQWLKDIRPQSKEELFQ